MRNRSPRFTALLLSLLITSGGLVSPARASAGKRGGKSAPPSKSSPQSQQEQYEALLKKRVEDAARIKARIEQTRARAAELRAQARTEKSQHEKVVFSFTSADSAQGISGSVTDKVSGVTLRFESKVQGELLASRISNRFGATLIEYFEAERALVTDPVTGVQSYEPAPLLRFDGVMYREMNGPMAEAMGHFASAVEGDLLRKLAFYLVDYLPGEDLETERRGLEVPFQAMQKLYESAAIGEYGGGELKTARRYGAKRFEETKSLPPRRDHEPIVAQPVDCEKYQCAYVDSHDFQLSSEGGYVVKSLSPRLPLSHNFAPPYVRGTDDHHHDDDAVAAAARGKSKNSKYKIIRTSAAARAPRAPRAPRRRDDASQVGDCFGRCGPGCGDWSHQWIGDPVVIADFTYCEPPDPDSWMPDCSTFCCSTERRVTSYAGTAVHTAHGKVTFGSVAHDACVRALGLPAWLTSLPGMPCFPELLLAADCYVIPGVGEEQTWSYIGPHAEGWDAYTGNCCVTIGPIS